MTFNKILETVTDDERNSMADQVLKRREYNRRYQAKLRQRAKLDNLHKKIDQNLDAVLAYIHKRYADEYAAWTPPIVETIDAAFSNWVVLSAAEYPSIKHAYELSGLTIKYDDFKRWFLLFYTKNNSGSFTKH